MTRNGNSLPPNLLDVCNVVIGDQRQGYLLVQEGEGIARGKWNIPGGHKRKKEDLSQSALREGREETGYELRLILPEPIFEAPRPADGVSLHAYLAEIIGGELVWPEGEIIDARVFPSDAVLGGEIELRDPEYITDSIKKAQEYERSLRR